MAREPRRPIPFTSSLAHHAADPFRLLVESVKDYAIFMLDPAGAVASWNSGAERILCYAPEEILEKSCTCFYVAEDVARGTPQRELQLALAEERYEVEGERVRKDGTTFWAIVTTTALHDYSQEQHIGFAVVVRDITERRQAEAARRASEEPFRLMIEGVKDYAIHMLDPAGRITTWNSGAERLLGYSAGEIIGQSYSHFFTPDDMANGVPERELEKVATHGKASDEGWRTRKDGSRFWANGVLTALYDDAGALRGFCRVARDLTERRQIEVLLRSVLDYALDGILSLDEHGTIETFNHAAERIFGYSQTEVLGENVNLLMPSLYHDAPDGYLQSYLHTGEPNSLAAGREVEGRRKDGTRFPVELAVSAFQLELDGRPHYTGIVRDITQRLEAEDTQARLVGLLEATPDFVAVYTADTRRCLFLNRAARLMVGRGENEDLSAATMMDFHPAPVTQHLEEEGIPAALRTGAWRGETAVLTGDGRRIPVSQVLVAHKAAIGDVRFLSTIMRDLTEQKGLEEQLRQAQKMESVARLAGGLAHDFNNMLTVITATAELAATSLPANDPMLSDLAAILEAGARAGALTRQLLAFGRKQILQPTIVNLNTVVASVEAMLRRVIGEHIDLTVVPAGDLASVRVDLGQIEQVILNLVINGRDAMPDGGRLIIRTDNVVLDETYTRTQPGVQPGPYVLLAISDNGSGMDEATRQRVFEPFFTTKGLGQGTGLGLSSAYGTVKQSGGDIWVYSEVGRGTTVKVYLPQVDGAPRQGRAPPSEMSAGGTETILLVEDDEAIRRVAKRGLSAAGYDVLVAAGGSEALLALERHPGPVHLVVTDVVMPGMSGRELARRLESRNPGIKILYASGFADDAIIHHGVLEESEHFLSKPYTIGVLSRKVRQVLDL